MKKWALASSIWGQAWCRHLVEYGHYASRLPRGRTYLRDGRLVAMEVLPGRIRAKVQGSTLYQVDFVVKPLPDERWTSVKERCHGQVDSLLTLLQGQLAAPVMALLTDPDTGLFPSPTEIQCGCTCPDEADLCKHAAATLYGFGGRLDERPEDLFVLRGVNHLELIESALADGVPAPLEGEDLGALFGIDLDA